MRDTADVIVARRAAVGVLLSDPALSLRQIAKQIGISPQGVQLIQSKHFPEFRRPRGVRPKPKPKPEGIVHPKTFQRKLIQALRSIGETWCYDCLQVKCLAEFPPMVQRGRNGIACTHCNGARIKRRYHSNPEHRQYAREYQRSHREAQAKYRRRWESKTRKERILERQLKRLEQMSPVLADAVRQGQMTLEDVMQKIGLTRQRYARVRVTVGGFESAILQWLTQSEQTELKELLAEGETAHGG